MSTNTAKSDWLTGLFMAALLTGTYLLYYPGLQGPLIFDDYPNLSNVLQLDVDDWRPAASNILSAKTAGALGRPVAMASFIFDGITHGDDVRYYKYTNLLLHLITGLLLFGLARRLFIARGNAAPSAGLSAALVAGIWLLHPQHVSTVLYTVQRMTELSALFQIGGLYLYVIGRQRQLAQSGGLLLILSAYLIALPLATLSKENGLLLPLLIFWVELLVFRFTGAVNVRRAIWGTHLAFLLLPGLFLATYLVSHFESLIVNAYIARDFTLDERLLTQPRVVSAYIYQWLMPLPGNMGFMHDDLQISSTLFKPLTTLLSVLWLGFMLAVAAWQWRQRPLLSLGILLFFSGHIMESSFIPLEMMFEHRNYLPSIGLSLAIVSLSRSWITSGNIRIASSLAVLVLVATMCGIRASAWQSQDRFYADVYAARPGSPWINSIYANFAVEAGRYEEAYDHLSPYAGNGFRLHELYVRCRQDGRVTDQDLIQVRDGLNGLIDSYAATGLIELANFGLDNACAFDKSLFMSLLDKALTLPIHLPSTSQSLHVYRAHFLHARGQLEAALQALETAYRVFERGPMPLYLATEWLIDSGDTVRARASLQRAISVAESTGLDYGAENARIRARIADLEESSPPAP